MSAVATSALVIAIVLIVFIVLAIYSRRILRRRRRNMNPLLRAVLQFMAGLTKPAAPISFSRKRDRKLGSRSKTEPHYRLEASEQAWQPAAPLSSAGPSAHVERPAGSRKRPGADLSLLPGEAWPFYADDEIAAVEAVLRSGKVNQWTGTKVVEFEQAYTRDLRNGRAIAVANGSVGLELALRALGIGAGDEVIVTPRSFVASAFCARLVGATPVFADVDPISGNLTAETIAAAITPRTRAVIPVHLAGWPAEMMTIGELAKARDLLVIEDCAQAHGAEIDGLPVGSFGDAAVFSFCQDKIISTAGEGGLVNFRDNAAYEWAWSFKDHGKNRARAIERGTGTAFRWLHDSVGTNWRLTEIAATVGLLQLEKLPRWRAARARNAQIWADALASIEGIRAPLPPRNITGAYYKFYAYVDSGSPTDDARLRDEILAAGSAMGVRIFSGSCSEMYREAAFDDLNVSPLPVARQLGQNSLMFEVHPTLDERRLRDRADAVAAMIEDVMG